MFGRCGAMAAAALAVAAGLAHAQVRYDDAACGRWNGDAWMSNGSCRADVRRHERVDGRITHVEGHVVTVARTTSTLTIDDSPALANKLAGDVAAGRRIVAYGYWDAGRFYATIIRTRR